MDFRNFAQGLVSTRRFEEAEPDVPPMSKYPSLEIEDAIALESGHPPVPIRAAADE
jgi:hypothetical protein